MYLELIGFVVFKIFASFGLCDHVHSFMAIVHIDACWLAMSEKTLLKSKILNSLSLINSLNYLCENPHSWSTIKSSVNEAYMERLYYLRHNKNGNPSSPRKIEMEGLHNHQFEPRSKMEWSLSWKFLFPSSNDLYVKESILIIFKQLMEGLENPFKEFFQYLLHSFPNPPISFLLAIDFLVKNGTYLL
jgi:hypothetical protein